jgi:hypothetical protein
MKNETCLDNYAPKDTNATENATEDAASLS